jgi:hypothetical protein
MVWRVPGGRVAGYGRALRVPARPWGRKRRLDRRCADAQSNPRVLAAKPLFHTFRYRNCVRDYADRLLLLGVTQQFVEAGNDLQAFGARRSANRTQWLQCHGDDLERVKDNRCATDLERGIEMPELGLADGTGPHERHYNPASVVIERSRLHDNSAWNGYRIPVKVECDV